MTKIYGDDKYVNILGNIWGCDSSEYSSLVEQNEGSTLCTTVQAIWYCFCNHFWSLLLS